MIIPNMNAFLTMLYSHLNIYKKGQIHSKEDTEFLRTIKKIIQDQDSLSQNLRTPEFVQNNILIFPEDTDLSPQYDDLIKIGLINSSTVKIKAYNPDRPIYVRDSNGEILELSNHPDRKCDWDKKITYKKYTYSYIPFLKYNGISDEKIKELRSFCNNKHHSENVSHLPKKSTVNMQPLQVEHKIEKCFLEL